MGVLDKLLDAIKLNDDYEDDLFEEEFEDDFEEEEELKPRKKFFDKFKHKDSDLEDEEPYDEEPTKKQKKTAAATKASISSATLKTPKQPKMPSSKITPMRSAKKNSMPSMEVCVIKPSSMEDTRDIADTLLDNCTVVLNLEGVDVDLAQRIIDFTSGCCYSLGGSLQKVSSYIFIITPHNVDVSGDFQNILGNAVPSIRSSY